MPSKEDLIKRFKSYMKYDLSLAENSIESYKRDVEEFFNFFNDYKLAPSDIVSYMSYLRKKDL